VLTTITAYPSSAYWDHPVNVAVDGSGRVIVAASDVRTTGNRADFLVARFNANGSLDTTFGAAHTGVVTTDIFSASTDRAYALALQSDGKIVVGGHATPDGSGVSVPAVLVRYNADGTLDATFDGDGIATAVWDVGPGEVSAAVAKAVFVQPDGKLLIAADSERTDVGTMHFGTILLMRFNPDGSPDLSYGPTGTRAVATSLGFHAAVTAMDVQEDGRVVVAGQMNTDDASLTYFALTRFFGPASSPSPVHVASLTASSTTVAAGSPLTLTAGGITTTNAGATITRVAFYCVDSTGAERFLGYGTHNADGTWTLTFTVNLAPGSYTLLALAVDSIGAVSDPFFLALDVV
jgi:uncharacterized delta-60 repeat protein